MHLPFSVLAWFEFFLLRVTVTLGVYLHVYVEIVIFVLTVIWHTYLLVLCAASNFLLLYAIF